MMTTIKDLFPELTCAACAVGIGGYALWMEWTATRRLREMAQACKSVQEVSTNTEERPCTR